MPIDLVEAYNSNKYMKMMYENLMIGVSKEFRWPEVNLLQVEYVQRYSGRDIMKLRFNVFKNDVVEVDVTELIHSMAFGSPGEKYEVVGGQAGIFLMQRCDAPIPSNIELGEN